MFFDSRSWISLKAMFGHASERNQHRQHRHDLKRVANVIAVAAVTADTTVTQDSPLTCPHAGFHPCRCSSLTFWHQKNVMI